MQQSYSLKEGLRCGVAAGINPEHGGTADGDMKMYTNTSEYFTLSAPIPTGDEIVKYYKVFVKDTP